MFYKSIFTFLFCLLFLFKNAEGSNIVNKREVKLLGSWKVPSTEEVKTSPSEIQSSDSTNPESTSIISEGNDLYKKDDHITISSEGPKTIKFLKPSDILSASGVKTVLNIPDIGKNSTHEVFIIADDGNATVIKGYNSISIKASTTIQ